MKLNGELNGRRNIKKRIASINKMILEVARGNFVYQIERSEEADELEGLVASVNMMAEELKVILLQRGNLNGAYKNITGMVFMLDTDFKIQVFNSVVSQTLQLDDRELKGKSLRDFLTPESTEVLEGIKTRLADGCDASGPVELLFKTKQNLIVPMLCSVSFLFDSTKQRDRILVTAFETVLNRKEAKEEMLTALEYQEGKYRPKDDAPVSQANGHRLTLREEDIRRIREAKNFILQHIDNPCSLKELAKKVGINDFKLKSGFKELYGTTVFGFLFEERMQQAKVMLVDREMSIKELSMAIGYKNLSNFTSAFKKRFGYPPSFERRKRSIESEDEVLQSMNMLA